MLQVSSIDTLCICAVLHSIAVLDQDMLLLSFFMREFTEMQAG